MCLISGDFMGFAYCDSCNNLHVVCLEPALKCERFSYFIYASLCCVVHYLWERNLHILKQFQNYILIFQYANR